ncbi:MAG: DUF1573 domain-containing protein [Bacteroidota bacterium]
MNYAYLLRGAFAAALFATIAGNAAHAQGKIEIVGGNTHDWGSVKPDTLKAIIQVKNVGTGDLTISDVHPGCGCTLTNGIDKKVLKPGEIGKFDVSINVTTYPAGPISKIVRVTSSDPTDSIHVVQLAANIKRGYAVAPSSWLIINDAKQGAESVASVRIKNTSDGPITFFSPEFSNGNVTVRFDMKGKREVKPGEDFELKAYITPKEKESLYGAITMKTSSKDDPSVQLSITGTMAPAAQVNVPVNPQASH